MAPPPLVFEFISVVFTAIFYGKYCGIVSVQTTTWSECPVIGFLMPDIRLILADPTQENRSMERRTPLPLLVLFCAWRISSSS